MGVYGDNSRHAAHSGRSYMKTLKDFEHEHGGPRIAALEKALQSQARARHPIDLELPCRNNTLVFGVVGDTHFGSLYEAKDEYAATLQYFKSMGVTSVLHAGDILDGHGVYKGQEFELHAHGWAAQRDWAVEHVPKIPGITTYFVTGNHDASFKKAAGVDVGNELADRREDWEFLGEDRATVVFYAENGRPYRVMLLHPSGGSSYAVSYRPQKIAEQLEGGTKPNMLVIGHYHKANWLPTYRNISCLLPGAFQWQTPFMVTKGLSAHVGGWLVRVTLQDPEVVLSNAVHAEFISFYSKQV